MSTTKKKNGFGKRVMAMVAAILLVGGAITGGFLLDDRYAKAEDSKNNHLEIKKNGLRDNIRWYQDQMSYILNRCNVRDPGALPEHAYQNYRNYQIQKESLDREYENLMKQQK